ncbi:MAG: hypothetical protein NC899_08525 [Candidatus Omnitrophica bacterium]|nr:hypothetical protein [Candidatus Omnitrophota bacterium]
MIIVDKISSYFKKLFSVQFEGDMEMHLTSSDKSFSAIPLSKHNLKYKFINNGNKYRIEVYFFDPFIKKEVHKIVCWNGEQYQLLETGEKRVLSISKSLPQINPYFIPNPLLFPFTFLLKKGDYFSLNYFQNQQLIKERLKNIEKIEEGQRGEYKGIYIYFTKQGQFDDKNFENYKIFLARELNYFPIFSEIFIGEEIREEMEVKEFLKIDDIIIPIVIYSSAYKKEKLLRTVKVSIDKETVKINVPIEEEFFNIPFSHVDKVWDSDTKTWLK